MAANFQNASDEAIDIGIPDFSSGLDQCSISAWIKPLNVAGDYRFLAKADGTSLQDHWWTLQHVSTNLMTRTKINGTTTQISGGTLVNGVWQWCLMTYDGTDLKLFINNVEVATTGRTGNLDIDNSITAQIGNNPTANRAYDGDVELVQIHEKVLSVEERAFTYQTRQPIFDKLKYFWPLNEKSDGSTIGIGEARDLASGLDNTGVKNTPTWSVGQPESIGSGRRRALV